MIENWKFETDAQKEALLNELKGHLFEFLVGSALARSYGIEADFLHSLTRDDLDRLAHYERWVRENDKNLARHLPLLASMASKALLERAPKDVVKVKISARDSEDSESDITLEAKSETRGISLKLCKENAFVNTKSGGVLSFMSKYFGPHFNEAKQWQAAINNEVDQSFLQMGATLYELAGIEGFEGEFDERWRESGHSHLPGQLPMPMREALFEHYSRVISKIHEAFHYFFKKDLMSFKSALWPIVGLGAENIMQMICTYPDNLEQARVHIFDSTDLTSTLDSMSLGELVSGLASFELRLADAELQIRVKPMNAFTGRALKVNCSVRRRR
jgi:hypothetical protein